VLLEPEEVAAFYFASAIDGPEAYFTRRSRSWVHYVPSPGHDFHAYCVMPPGDGWRTWLREQLELRVTRPTDPGLERSYVLSALEWATLLLAQEVLRRRAEAAPGGLDDEAAALATGDVRDLIAAGEAGMPSLVALPSMLAAVEALHTDPDAADTTMRRLAERGLLLPYPGGRYLYSPFAKSALDPGNVVEHAHVSWRREEGGTALAASAAMIVHADKVVLLDADPDQMLVRLVVRSVEGTVRYLEEELLRTPFASVVEADAELAPAVQVAMPAPATAPTWVCASCGAELRPGAKFCTECGTPVVAAPGTCASCGAGLRDGARFCPNCGTPVA
jgi:hypothetical protein